MNQTEFLNPKNDILCCWELGLTWIFNFCRTWAEIWIVKTFLNQKAFTFRCPNQMMICDKNCLADEH